MVIKIGTRGSRLALSQTNIVKQLIEEKINLETEINIIDSKGDHDQKSRLTTFGSQGIFTGELESQLIQGSIDIAVHSLKDLPVLNTPNLELIAFIKRHSAGDSLLIKKEHLISRNPLKVDKYLKFGTGSPRRQSQFLEFEPSAIPIDIRGNVETRIGLLQFTFIDALIMATAVFERLDLTLPKNIEKIDLPVDYFPPTPGQGVIVIQTKIGDFGKLEELNDLETQIAVNAEREVLANSGGGCELSLGVYIHKNQTNWVCHATKTYNTWNPSQLPNLSRFHFESDNLETLSNTLGNYINKPENVTSDIKSDLSRRRIILASSSSTAQQFSKLLEAHGAETFRMPIFDYKTDLTQLNNSLLVDQWYNSEWLIISSQQSKEFVKSLVKIYPHTVRIACIGQSTAKALRSIDMPVHLVANGNMMSMQILLKEARAIHPGQVIYLRGLNYTSQPSEDAHSFAVYSTITRHLELPIQPTEIVAFSTRSAKAILEQLGSTCTFKWVAIGPTTGKFLADLGQDVIISQKPTPEGVYEALTAS